jgi:hypothetical protein
MSKFQKGDIVTLTGKGDAQDWHNIGWMTPMVKAIGKPGIVISSQERGEPARIDIYFDNVPSYAYATKRIEHYKLKKGDTVRIIRKAT